MKITPNYLSSMKGFFMKKGKKVSISLLKDKEIPALIVWEKYLVYATAFKISSKVTTLLLFSLLPIFPIKQF